MVSIEIMLLGMALAMDAAVVTFAVSLLHERDTPSMKLKNGFLVSFTFGLFQFLMLWLGSYAGFLFTFSTFGYYFQVVIGLIFFGLAWKCIHESFSLEEKKIEWDIIPVVILAFATSIDALASGISLGTIPRAHLAALEVGLITSMMCASFYFIGQFFREIPDKWLLRLASLIFLILGLNVLWAIRHLFVRG
jgi:manganese efflux pump family protein